MFLRSSSCLYPASAPPNFSKVNGQTHRRGKRSQEYHQAIAGEAERFRADATYAYFLSNFNVLTYLTGHKDGRDGNFLTAKDPKRRQVFAVDNGVAFDIPYGGIYFNWFVPNWNRVRIPAIRTAAPASACRSVAASAS